MPNERAYGTATRTTCVPARPGFRPAILAPYRPPRLARALTRRLPAMSSATRRPRVAIPQKELRMSHRNGAAVLAASALLACAGLVRAAEPQAPARAASGLTLDTPVYLQQAAQSQQPADTTLMGLADKVGLDLGS